MVLWLYGLLMMLWGGVIGFLIGRTFPHRLAAEASDNEENGDG